MQLERYDAARAALECAHSVDEVKQISNVAAAAQAYARQAQDTDLESMAAEIRLRAERRLGEILGEMRDAGQRAAQGRPRKGDPVSRLSELGITRKQAERSQQLASVKAPDFESYIAKKRAAGEVVTSGEVRRHFVRQMRRPPVTSDAGVFDGTYRVVYADPPWAYRDSGTITESDSYGRAERHYPTMSVEEIAAFRDDEGRRVVDVVHDDAALFLWVPAPLLRECWPVVDAWGFEFKTHLVWDKVRHNFGHYVSARHEDLLLCTRGRCVPDRLKPMVDSVVTVERSHRHSEKPEKFRRIITRLYDGPYLELFGRNSVKGWQVFGNQRELVSAGTT